MKSFVRLTAVCVAVAAFSSARLVASTADDVLKAQKIITQVVKLMEQYKNSQVQLTAPSPIAGNTGAYLLPYKADGALTAWAEKALSAQLGKAVGAKAGDAATNAVASKVPFGGLAGGLIKKKTKEVGAVVAMGGMDFIKNNSELSLGSLEEYAVYLQAQHAGDSNYQIVLATAIALYPDLETKFESAISQAYQKAAAKAAK